MHEYSLVKRILERACEVARDNGGHPISRIHVDIGELQQVEPDAMDFAFEAAKHGTLAEDAAFDWRQVPARIRCGQCGHTYHPDGLYWTCPECENFGGVAVAGDDVLLRSVILELPDAAAQ